MLVDDHPQHAVWAKKILKNSGFHTLSFLPTISGLLFQMEKLKPHVVMINIESPDQEILESLSLLSRHQPTPVVMLSKEEDPTFIHQAINAGVTTYRVEDLDPEKTRAIIHTTIAQFERFQALRQQLYETQRELTDITVINKAKYLLIKNKRISEQDAHKSLRTLAMNNNKTMANVARNVVTILDKGKQET